MAKVPVPVIPDADAVPATLVAPGEDLPPIDTCLAFLRLSNPPSVSSEQGTGGSMTLWVALEGELWGIISLHHGKGKFVSADVWETLANGILPVFTLKLGILRQRSMLRYVIT